MRDTPLLPKITVLLTEMELAEEFIEALGRRRLDEKFFYWFPLSIKAWLELCSDGDYRNFERSRSLIALSAPEVASLAPIGDLEVVSLGSGQGDKDRILLHALRKLAREVSYLAVDSSQALLELACEGALAEGFAARGLKADFGQPSHLKTIAAGGRPAPRLVMMLGGTLGCGDPIQVAKDLRQMLRPGDLLLVDGELYSDTVIGGYDNPVNRRFAWAPLHSAGLNEGHGEIFFDMQTDYRMEGLHAVSKYFKARVPAEAFAGGETLRIEAGEKILMGHSYKYSESAFAEILDQAGLNPLWSGAGDDGQFVMTLASSS